MERDQESRVDWEQLAERLSSHPDFRVLRRIKDLWPFAPKRSGVENFRVGAAIDVETTGLDLQADVVIELAIQRFRYTDAGEISELGLPRSWRQDPKRPLDPLVANLTKLTDEDLRGQSIDFQAASAILSSTDLIVAHNASFDRPFVDGLIPNIQEKIWACTMTDINWQAIGLEGRSLSHLLAQFGWFYDGHRADTDVLALLYLLAQSTGSASTVLAMLLNRVAEPVVEVVAIRAPYEAKDALKKRSYKWSEALRAWRKEIKRVDLELELSWLSSSIYKGADVPLVRAVDSHERYRREILPL